MRLAICDVGDSILDSNVFIKAASFTTVAPIEVTKLVDFDHDGLYSTSESGLDGTSASWRVTIRNNQSMPATVTVTDSLHAYGPPFKMASQETRPHSRTPLR